MATRKSQKPSPPGANASGHKPVLCISTRKPIKRMIEIDGASYALRDPIELSLPHHLAVERVMPKLGEAVGRLLEGGDVPDAALVPDLDRLIAIALPQLPKKVMGALPVTQKVQILHVFANVEQAVTHVAQ